MGSLVDSYAQMRQIASSSAYFSSSPKRVSDSSSEVHTYVWTEKPFLLWFVLLVQRKPCQHL